MKKIKTRTNQDSIKDLTEIDATREIQTLEFCVVESKE